MSVHTPTAPADLFRPAIADALASRQRILIAGAGGGFDVFAGLPLFFALTAAGKTVFLANLSFTYLGGSQAQQLSAVLWRVDHTNTSDLDYFPERFLSQWLNGEGYPSDVYAFEKVGVRPLRAAYEALVSELQLDALVLVDGGTDILMRGDEAGLGTPAEDMTSLAAVRDLPLAKFVSCLGFGIDAFHGVCHAHFLENVAALERRGGYLGAHSLQLSDPSVAKFRSAVEYAHAKMPNRPSIVNGSILSALEGQFGNFQRTQRTQSSKLFINPLMAMYWHFELTAVAEASLYLRTLEHTDDIFEVQLLIEAFHNQVTIRPRTPIPV
jgi:hypothetical protein